MREHFIAQENEYQKGVSQTTGNIIRVLGDCERKFFKIASMTSQLMSAINLGQVHLIYNRRGNPLGYLAWSFITEQVLAQLKKDPLYILHFSEWNEGDIVYLFDVVSPYGYTKELLHSFRIENFSRPTRVVAKRGNKTEWFDRLIEKKYEYK